MDLAGTAVGTIAIGLEVCKGLAKYYRAVKGRNKDIVHIAVQIEGLQSTFESLESILPRVALSSSDQTAVVSAITCLSGCEDGVNELKRFHD